MKHITLALLLLAACAPPVAPKAPVAKTADAGKFQVAGPYAHGNLAVYLITSKERDDREFITLDEGLKNGWVKVSEKDDEQVRELRIENTCGKPLFLQEGDRVQGGKQDRIVGSSLVVPANSPPQPLPSFCIEHGRWTEGQSGRSFGYTANSGCATKDLRMAAKVSGDQGEIWKGVAEQKKEAAEKLGSANTNDSFNETMDDPKVKKLSDEAAAALAKAVEKHPDAVGVAFCVNGRIEEVNVYPGHKLLAKIYPRLVQGYALEAALAEGKPQPAPSAADVAKFMTEADGKERQTKKIDAANGLVTVDGKEKVTCTTEYGGKAVHQQWFSKRK